MDAGRRGVKVKPVHDVTGRLLVERRIMGETDEAGRAGEHMCLPFYRSPLEAQTHTSTWSPSARLAWPPSTVRHIKWRLVLTTAMITGQLNGSPINSSQFNLNRNICKASCLFRTAITSYCFLRWRHSPRSWLESFLHGCPTVNNVLIHDHIWNESRLLMD